LLLEDLGAPEEVLQFTLEEFQTQVNSYEELWAEFKRGYLELAATQMREAAHH
jgi:hypothetical protein